MKSAQDLQIVHIIGSGHSGSTLLDMMLGGHSQISALGEAYFLQFNILNRRKLDVCTCGNHPLECPFWLKVETAAQEALETDTSPALASLLLADPRMAELMDSDGRFRERKPGDRYSHRSRINQGILALGSTRLQNLLSRWVSEVRLHRRIAKDTITLYELVRRAHQTPIIVDSTKNPGTFKNIYLQATAPMQFLRVIRDGRAVCASRMRREGVSMPQAAAVWLTEQIKRRTAEKTIRNSRIKTVYYENLASAPADTIDGICRFLGIETEPRMLDFRRERHNLGGNPMRLRRNESSIRLDERWRTQLSNEDLRWFERIAGSMNRALGYSRF